MTILLSVPHLSFDPLTTTMMQSIDYKIHHQEIDPQTKSSSFQEHCIYPSIDNLLKLCLGRMVHKGLCHSYEVVLVLVAAAASFASCCCYCHASVERPEHLWKAKLIPTTTSPSPHNNSTSAESSSKTTHQLQNNSNLRSYLLACLLAFGLLNEECKYDKEF